MTGKLPPQAIEIEEAILGALLLDKNSIDKVTGIIKPESFYKESHKVIYNSILDLYLRNEPIDILTVTNDLRKKEKLNEAGGAFFVAELTSNVSSSANIEYHARIVAEKAIKRDFIRIGTELVKKGYDDTVDTIDLISFSEDSVIEVNSYFTSGKSKYVRQLVGEAIEGIKNASMKPNGITGIPSGITPLDRVIGGWQNSDLVLIGARPSMGKTDLAINLAINAAKNDYKVAIYSLEMSDIQNVLRMMAIDREIGRTEIRKGSLTESDWSNLSMFSNKISNNIILMDEPNINHINIRSGARKLYLSEKINMIIIDYMQLIESPGSKLSQVQKIGEISRSLKLMAKELNIPVIALSQLSRAVETRGGDKRPQLSDLRDSGNLEQDADIIIFPYRPEYYGFETMEDGSSTYQLMELDIAKHRNGAVETVFARYLGKFGKIVDWKNTQEEPYNPNKFPSQAQPF
jgi:replicative DNA helicase